MQHGQAQRFNQGFDRAAARFVAYYRVSTDKQGRSGLGLDAQRRTVEGFLAGAGALVEEFTEVESGKRNDRPCLEAALRSCRLYGATLLVAKLDRLSRNAAFLLTLRDSGVRFVAADMPEATDLTVGIMALVAQQEREAISRRTKEALASAKARGVILGTPRNLSKEAAKKGREKGSQANRKQSQARARDVYPIIQDIQEQGSTSLKQIAAELSARGIPTASGNGSRWYAAQVKRVLDMERGQL